MNIKYACIYVGGLTLVLTVLIGVQIGHGNDTEYRYYAALRMHACDILENDHSTLLLFDPDSCQVKRRNFLIGQMIDVTCMGTRKDGSTKIFRYSYSAVHLIFEYFYEKTYALRRGGHCRG